MPSAKAAEIATATLQRLYGAAVIVHYHNLDDAAECAAHADTLAAFEEEGWRLPVTLLDGQLLFLGGLQPARLVVAIARERARRGLSAPASGELG